MEFVDRNDVTLDEYIQMISGKTGALIAASLKMGGIAAGAPLELQDTLFKLGMEMGIAFQIQDDILDATGDDHTLGKLSGADARQSKSTYVSLLGIDGARSALQTTLEQSRQSLGDANLLTASFDQLIHFVAHRDY